MRSRCKRILELMKAAGYDVVEPEAVDRWTDEEVEYFHTNYDLHYPA